MASNVAPSILLNSHKKRPHHPSPIQSYRSHSSQERHGLVKRARWDVSNPTPSPPILSLPLPPLTGPSSASSSPSKKRFQFASAPSAFRFGLQPSTPSTTLDPSSSSRPITTYSHHARPKRHRSHTSSTRGTAAYAPRIADDDDDDDRVRGFERLRRSTLDEGELFVSKMREWEEQQAAVSSSASSLPYMSQSITSNSTSCSDVFGAGRKRSWSISQDDEDAISRDADMDVEWEVVRTVTTTATNDANMIDAADSMASSVVSGDDGDGDDEQEDEDDQVSDDSDDDLIFVVGTTGTEGKGAPTVVPPAGAERMISELEQILAAGGAGLEESLIVPTDPDRTIDAGSLWQ